MNLKFKNRRDSPSLKKVMIYGLDGSGKSTFAKAYCDENNLKPVVLDIDDTNFTDVPSVELDFSTDLKTYNSVKSAITELGKMDDFDTIILDGVTSLLEMLVSNAKGMASYSDRSKRWNSILRTLLSTKKNILFIGQIDMEVIYTADAQSSKAVIKVNSLCNEKYRCYIDDKGNYTYEVKKFRTIEELESIAHSQVPKEQKKVAKKEVVEAETTPVQNNLDSAKEIAQSIIAELPANNKVLVFAKIKVKELVDRRVISAEECPQVIAELERLL